jgi:hypothetical protein
MPEWLGWSATAVFVGSYGFKRPGAIRVVQALGACLWIVYGVLLGARPVVLANTLVVGAAMLSLWRDSRGSAAIDKQPEAAAQPAVTSLDNSAA